MRLAKCHPRDDRPRSLSLGIVLSLVMMNFLSQAYAQSSSAPIGVAAVVRGTVEAVSPGEPARALQSGLPIFLGDQVTTDALGNIQILLKDGTTFTLGPASSVIMSQFVFDPQKETGKIVAEVVQGVFRFVTGKIGQKEPENMEVKLPVGNIGIRGTIVGGRAEGNRSRVVLLGPGRRNNTGNRAGIIEVSNQVKNKTEKVTVDKTGFGTLIEGPDQAPARAALVPTQELQELIEALQPSWSAEDAGPVVPGAGEASATEEAGQDTYEALGDWEESEEDTDLVEDAGTATNQAAQNATQIGRVADGIATFDDLSRLESGQFHFLQEDHTLAPDGDYSIHFDIDFGNRTVGGGNSHVGGNALTLPGDNSFQYLLASRSFSGSGSAIFAYSGISDTDGASDGSADVTVSILNSGGVIATHAEHVVDINGTHSGSDDQALRVSGLSSPD